THCVRHIDSVATQGRAKPTPTPAELGHARGAVTRTAGPLLRVHLLARAPDLRAAFGFVGAALTLGELPIDTTLDDISTWFEAKNWVRQRGFAGFLAIEGDDLELHHSPSFFFAADAALSAALAA